ncbi:hypothetical protein JW796_01295 [Candidatus Dojkabacteria bacterium]|nr:hypothetical protein [Candidatus Dojkabacteria bacterium]
MEIFNKTARIGITAVLLLVLSFTNTSFFSHFGAGSVPVKAGLQDDLKSVQDRLADIKNQKRELEGKINNQKYLQGQYTTEISRLQNEVGLLDLQISEKKLKIDELVLQLEILTDKIDETDSSIIDSEIYIKDLESDTDNRLSDMYIEQKVLPKDVAIVFTASSTDGFIKGAQYRKAIQEDINKTLKDLNIMKKNLEEEKKVQEEDKVQLEKDRAVLDEERISLEVDMATYNQQKIFYDNLLSKSHNSITGAQNSIKNLSDEEGKLVAKYDALVAAILARGEVGNGLPVAKGTLLGIEGNTGYSYGAHLHFMVYDGGYVNPCNYLPAGAYPSCSGNGELKIPLQPKGTLTSGYGPRWGGFHYAIDISTGGGGWVVAAHDGYVYFGFEPCPSWAPVCNNGGAIYAKVCQTNGCSTGKRTLYYHLSCTMEPSSSPRSCN